MKIAVDFDGTIVEQDHHYDDLETPLTFIRGAKEALLELKQAGHLLLLWSARANRALLVDPNLDPFMRARGGATSEFINRWAARRQIHAARFEQMIKFVIDEMPGVFSAVDDGSSGKPMVDLFIDDRCLRLAQYQGGVMGGMVWPDAASLLGSSVFMGGVKRQQTADQQAQASE